MQRPSRMSTVVDHLPAADILAVADPGSLPDGDNLDRLRDLLAGLGGMILNGDLLGWVSPGDLAAVPRGVRGDRPASAGRGGDEAGRHPAPGRGAPPIPHA